MRLGNTTTAARRETGAKQRDASADNSNSSKCKHSPNANPIRYPPPPPPTRPEKGKAFTSAHDALVCLQLPRGLLFRPLRSRDALSAVEATLSKGRHSS